MRRRSRSAGGGRGTRRGRTLVVCLSCLVGMVVAGPGVALAQDGTPDPEETPAVEVPEPVPGEEVCTIADPRLIELSGLVATDDQYLVVNDSQDLGFDDRLPIFFLDQDCQVVDQQDFGFGRPLDPEALEFDYDSDTLWVGDIGDNPSGVIGGEEGDQPRETAALWRVDLSGGDRTPVIHRFVYPDGQKRDAEALLLDSDGVPIIVTKEVGTAGLYKPTDLVPDNPPEQAVPLELLGEVSLPDTGSDNLFGAVGRQVVTGGAVAPDRSAVVLRTYADAFEFDVEDGDLVAAITTGEPRVTPLPEEPQGEAITYSPDGERFLTVSEVSEQPDAQPTIVSYTPTPPAEPPPPEGEQPAAPESGGGGFSLVNSVQDVINMIALVGVLGLILVTIGVVGIVRSRRRAARSEGEGEDSDEEADGAARSSATGRVVVGSRAAAGAVPEQGWEPEPDARHQPAGVYTSGAAAEYAGEYAGGDRRYGSTEYEGYSGTEYGGGYDDRTAARHGHHDNQPYGNGQPYGNQPYDQDWSDGAYPEAHQGGSYQSGQPAPDYYSDDPDYPYEFRGRRW